MPDEGAIISNIIVIDDHDSVRHSLRALLETGGMAVTDYATAETYLADGPSHRGDCLVVDINMPGMSGLDLQEELARRNIQLPLIVITGNADIKLAVRAMKAGALDFLEKPFDDEVLLATIRHAIADRQCLPKENEQKRRSAATLLALLTERERDVLRRLILGESNKAVAHHLGISPRTVEIHRANLQEKLKARSLSDLVRLARLAGQPA